MSKLPKLSKRKGPDTLTSIGNKIKSGKKRKSEPIMEQYMKFYNKAIEKYGKHVAVLVQVGKFFECYCYDGPDGNGKYVTNIYDLADAMGNIHVGKYNATAEYCVTNAKRCGFQTDFLPKFKNMLLEKNYTIVVVEQLNDSTSGENIRRKITKVISPGVTDQPSNFNYNNVVCIVIENQNPSEKLLHRIDQYELCVGMAAIDVSTNTSSVYEVASTRHRNPEFAANEVYRFLQTHNCKELVVFLENFKIDNEKEKKKLKRYFENALELDRYNVHCYKTNSIHKEFKKSRYQNKLLQKVFGSDVCGPGVQPIEYLNLQMYSNAVLSYCCLVDFIYQRNESYLKDLDKPIWWESDTHLVLTHNAIRQLDITRPTGSAQKGKNSSLFNIINHTITNQGKRLLESRLLRPFLNEHTLEQCYSQIQDLYDLEKELLSNPKIKDERDKRDKHDGCAIMYLRNKFRELCDYERYQRKIELGNIHPDELHILIQSYNNFIEILDWLFMMYDEYPEKMKHIYKLLPSDEKLKMLRQFSNQFYKVYDFNALKRNSSFKTVQENLFNQGVDEELDEISEHLGDVDQRLDKMRIRLCNIIDCVGDKREKIVTLRSPKNGGKMFRANTINSAILKWYQKQTRNIIYTSNKNEEEEAIKEIKVRHYDNPEEVIKYQGHTIIDSDILDWATKKKIEIHEYNSDEDEDEDARDNDRNSAKYLSTSDIKLLLTLNFRSNKTNMNITTNAIAIEEEASEEYSEKLLKVMYIKSQQFLQQHYTAYKDVIDIFQKLSAHLDLIQSHTRAAIRYQYFKPTVVPRKDDKGVLLPSFIDIKGFRHPIVERIQDDIEYIKNDLKLGRETFDDNNITGMLEFAINNSGKTCMEKAIALNIVLAQTGSFVPADSFRFRPFKNIITRLDGMDNLFKGQGSFAVEMSELRTVANQSTPNTLVLGDEICRGTEQDSAISIMAATIEWLCKERKANFIFSSHYHEVLDFEEISGLKELGVFHLRAYPDPNTGAIVYEYKLSKGVGTTIFGIEVARSMGYKPSVCDRAIHFRNKRLKKKQHYLSTKTSQYDTGVYMDSCSVKECKEEPIDSHHEAQQQTADQFGNIGHFHKNRKHNLFPLCKKHHVLGDKGLLHFEYKMTSNGVQLMCTEGGGDECL